MEAMFFWVTRHGYLGLSSLLMLGIVGLPIPDETLLLFAGYLIYKGTLHAGLTLLSAFLGSACGITLSYFLGRTLGMGLIHKYGSYVRITDGRVGRVHDWFRRVGRWGLVIGYYLPGVRHITALIAGSAELELWVFAPFAYSGALLWVATFISAGYVLGESWEKVSEHIHQNLLLATGAICSLLLVFLLVRRVMRKK